MAEKTRIAVFVSGGGTNLQALIDAQKSGIIADGEISIVRILVKAQVAKSNGEAKRLIQQGGISVNDEKVADFAMTISADKITSEDVIVKKGKKVFYKVVKA